MKAGCFTVCWLSAIITPVPKGPILQLVEKYRPISIASGISKQNERLVSARFFVIKLCFGISAARFP